jgi:hypothetical protein
MHWEEEVAVVEEDIEDVVDEVPEEGEGAVCCCTVYGEASSYNSSFVCF